MALVGEGDVGHGTLGRAGVDEDGVVALDEAVPFEVERDLLRSADHVAVCHLGLLGLGVHHLHELSHAALDGLDDVGLELGKGILNTNQILPVVVLFLDLLVEPVHDTALEDVWIFGGGHLAAVGLERSGVLAEEFNVFLRSRTSLVHSLGALSGALGQLLRLVLNLSMKAFEDGKDGIFQLLCCLVVLVRNALSVISVSRPPMGGGKCMPACST